MRGGYQIIDLKNKNHTSGVGMQHEEGLYEKIEGTKKPILITNLVYTNKEYQDCFATPFVVGSQFKFYITTGDGNMVITVEDTDVVTISVE